jgi:hypothetical protein
MLFVETSAKTGVNVEKTFTKLGEEIYSKVKEEIIDLTNDVNFWGISLILLELWSKSRLTII